MLLLHVLVRCRALPACLPRYLQVSSVRADRGRCGRWGCIDACRGPNLAPVRFEFRCVLRQVSRPFCLSSDACRDARSDKPCIRPAWGPARAAVQALRPFGSGPDACSARAFSESGFGFHPSEAVFRSRMDGIRTRNIAGMRVDVRCKGVDWPLG